MDKLIFEIRIFKIQDGGHTGFCAKWKDAFSDLLFYLVSQNI